MTAILRPVSVIIPTRNRPNLLRRAVQGVAIQKGVQIDLIVVDDGSDTDLLESNRSVVREFSAQARIVGFPHAEVGGKGPSAVRNLGLANARRDIVAFCDDDDCWIDEHHLARASIEFDADPALDIYFGNQRAITPSGAIAYETWQPSLAELVEGRDASETGALAISRSDSLCKQGDFAHMNTCVFRRALLDAIGGFAAEFRYCEDLDLYVRAVDRSKKILFNPLTVALHYVPDRNLKTNASSVMGTREKAIVLNDIALHLVRTCSSQEARRYASLLGAEACKRLAKGFSQVREPSQAAVWARRSLEWQPNMKWKLFEACVWLWARLIRADQRTHH